MKDVTLILPVRGNRMLLGMKKKGFGKGKLNGFGGHLELGESIEEAAVRELFEEVGLETVIDNLNKVGELAFSFPHKSEWDQRVHVYLIGSWDGEPRESDEMGFEWYDLNNIPTEKMWDADKHWMPEVLNGRKVRCNFTYDENNNIVSKEIFDWD